MYFLISTNVTIVHFYIPLPNIQNFIFFINPFKILKLSTFDILNLKLTNVTIVYFYILLSNIQNFIKFYKIKSYKVLYYMFYNPLIISYKIKLFYIKNRII